MENSSSSRSQSNKSGGASQQSEPRGGNYGAGGNQNEGSSEETPEQVVREMAWQMAKSASSSYNGQCYLADRFYNKMAGNDE